MKNNSGRRGLKELCKQHPLLTKFIHLFQYSLFCLVVCLIIEGLMCLDPNHEFMFSNLFPGSPSAISTPAPRAYIASDYEDLYDDYYYDEYDYDDEDTYDDDEPKGRYIINKYSMKFHLPDCSYAQKMNPDNKQYSNSSRAILVSLGYDPCNWCNP